MTEVLLGIFFLLSGLEKSIDLVNIDTQARLSPEQVQNAVNSIDATTPQDKNSEGYRMKNGSAFEVDLTFTQPSQERYFTVFQEDLKKAGVKLNLKQVDGTTQFKIGNQRNFSLIPVAWGGQNPPSHEFNIASKTANDTNSTNWPGFASKDIDQLVERYNITDSKDRWSS